MKVPSSNRGSRTLSRFSRYVNREHHGFIQCKGGRKGGQFVLGNLRGVV